MSTVEDTTLTQHELTWFTELGKLIGKFKLFSTATGQAEEARARFKAIPQLIAAIRDELGGAIGEYIRRFEAINTALEQAIQANNGRAAVEAKTALGILQKDLLELRQKLASAREGLRASRNSFNQALTTLQRYNGELATALELRCNEITAPFESGGEHTETTYIEAAKLVEAIIPEVYEGITAAVKEHQRSQLEATLLPQHTALTSEVETAIERLLARPNVNADPAETRLGYFSIDNLIKFVEKAKKLGKPGNYVAAVKAMREIKSVIIPIAENKARQAYTVWEAQLKKQATYVAKLDDATRKRNECQTLPGLNEVVERIDAIIAEAGVLAERNNYVEASARIYQVDSLFESGIFGLSTSTPAEKSAKAVEDLVRKRPSLSGPYNAAQQALTQFALVALPESLQARKKEHCLLIDQIMQAGDQTANPIESLNQWTTALVNMVRVHEAEKTNAERAREAAQRELNTLTSLATSEQIAPYLRRMELASAALAANRFADAAKVYELLLAECLQQSNELSTGEEEWSSASSELPTLRSSLGTLKSHELMKARAEELLKEAEQAEALASRRQYGEALGRLTLVTNGVAMLKPQLASFLSFKEICDRDIAPTVDGKIESIELALTALDEKVKLALGSESTHAGSSEALDRFRADLTQLKGTWASRRLTACSEEELGASSLLTDLETLRLAIMEATDNTGEIDRFVAEIKLSEQRAAYQGARSNVVTSLREMGQFDSATAATFQARFGEIDKASSADFPAASDLLATQLRELNTALEQKKAEQARLLIAVNTAKASAEEKVSTLETTVNDPTFAPFFTSLHDRITDLQAMCTSTSVESLKAAKAEFEALVSELEGIASDFASPKPGGATFKAVSEKISSLEEQLKETSLTDYIAKQTAALTKQLTRVKKVALGQPPAEALKTLEEFDTQVTAAKAAAEEAKELREQFAESLREVNSSIKRLASTHESGHKEYLKALAARLKVAESKISQEGEELTAIRELASIKAEANLSLTDLEYLAQQQRVTLKAQFDLELQEAQWNGELAVFEKVDLLMAKQAVHSAPNGDQEQIKQLERMRDQAKKVAEQKDYAQALHLLQMARARAVTVKNEPQGLKVTSRNNLAACEKRWQAAVRSFSESIDTLVEKLGIDPELGESELSSLRPHLNKIRELTIEFNTLGFSSPILTLQNSAASTKDLRRAREDALVLVRQYLTKLQKDPLLVHTYTNPFHTVTSTSLYASVNDLNTNLLRSV